MQTTLHLNAFLLWTHLIISDDFKKLHFQLILGYFNFHLDVLSTLTAFQTSEENNLNIFRVLSFTLSELNWINTKGKDWLGNITWCICWVKHGNDNSLIPCSECSCSNTHVVVIYSARVNRKGCRILQTWGLLSVLVPSLALVEPKIFSSSFLIFL